MRSNPYVPFELLSPHENLTCSPPESDQYIPEGPVRNLIDSLEPSLQEAE